MPSEHLEGKIAEDKTMGAENDISECDDVFEEVLNGSSPKQNDMMMENEPGFGLLFDIDGVIARGSKALEPAQEMIKLISKNGEFKVPIAFVTNGCNRDSVKAEQLEKWLDIKISTDQVIHAQTPLTVFESYKSKFILCLGQGPLKDICADMGFTNVCFIEDVKECYPLLDMVDHDNRKRVAQYYIADKPLPKIEGIIMFGEPVRWESNLQLLIDLLVTDGDPTKAPEDYSTTHVPILACNMDLVFMAEACMPRFGHGAFLVCLEALYKKITGFDLKYSALIGKPSEITYRYAEDCIAREARKMGIERPITKLYFFGDNPEVDIVGANLYDKYIARQRRTSSQMLENFGGLDVQKLRNEIAISRSRAVPAEAQFARQHVRRIEGILVETGVYKPEEAKVPINLQRERRRSSQGHRDFENHFSLRCPSKVCANVYDGVKHAIEQEHFQLA